MDIEPCTFNQMRYHGSNSTPPNWIFCSRFFNHFFWSIPSGFYFHFYILLTVDIQYYTFSVWSFLAFTQIVSIPCTSILHLSCFFLIYLHLSFNKRWEVITKFILQVRQDFMKVTTIYNFCRLDLNPLKFVIHDFFEIFNYIKSVIIFEFISWFFLYLFTNLYSGFQGI